MSELTNIRDAKTDFRRQLLATASAIALLSFLLEGRDAKASDANTDNPPFWIELGGQLEQQTGQGEPYAPPFVTNYAASPAYKPVSPQDLEKAPLFSNGAQAKLMFQPTDSDWVFSASVRYGRANDGGINNIKSAGHAIHYGYGYFKSSGFFCCRTGTKVFSTRDIVDASVTNRDSHTILDFEAGKDIGLGLFGNGSTSQIMAGVRFAQFTASASASLHARPDLVFYNRYAAFTHKYPEWYVPVAHFHTFGGSANSARSFRGIGPSLSWDASVPFLGSPASREFSFDWGVNGAALVGRRKAQGSHHETGHYHQAKYQNGGNNHYYYSNNPPPFARAHSILVPNVGGFAGLSLKFPNAKISLGYRGDFFFGAMDTGWDKEKTKTVGFYGPFATISVGIGG